MDDMPRNRAETGPMIFGDDWRGIFIRGDNSMFFITQLQLVLELDGDNLSKHSKEVINGTINEFCRSNHHSPDKVQMMKPFKECFIKDEGENTNTD